jgi:hypothetical protein
LRGWSIIDLAPLGTKTAAKALFHKAGQHTRNGFQIAGYRPLASCLRNVHKIQNAGQRFRPKYVVIESSTLGLSVALPIPEIDPRTRQNGQQAFRVRIAIVFMAYK